MANTRDIIGEKATLAGLVGNTLTTLEDDGVRVLRAYALSGNTALTSVRMPNVTRISTSAFSQCTGLTEITANDFPSLDTIESNAFLDCTNLARATFSSGVSVSPNAFNNCKALSFLEFTDMVHPPTIYTIAFQNNNKLETVIIRYSGSTVPKLSGVNAFEGTKIGNLLGAIYVPSSMVSAYKAATNWSNFIIASIDQYPLTDFSRIADSWDTIISYANAGTIGDHYAIGDTKKVTIDGVDYYAQLVGINEDTLSSDGTSKANSTWMLRSVLAAQNGSKNRSEKMNDTLTAAGGWTESKMRNTTLPAILQTFPANLQSAIKTVNKVSYRYEDTSEQVTADKLWIPNTRELNYEGGNLKETTGACYANMYTDIQKIKAISNSDIETQYWLRSSWQENGFGYVSTTGSLNISQANSDRSVLLGFCI